MGTHFLIAARDYWGTTAAVKTANMYAEFARALGAGVKTLLGDSLTVGRFLQEYKAILGNLNEPGSRVVVVTIGHGNQFPDADGDEDDGRDEGWQLPDGVIVDDTFTRMASEAQCGESSLFVLVSDHCSSGTMIDPGCRGNWANVASSQAWQDSLASGEGNVMSCLLLEYLRGKTPTVEELSREFPAYMAGSWVGDLQVPLITFGGGAGRLRLFSDANA